MKRWWRLAVALGLIVAVLGRSVAPAGAVVLAPPAPITLPASLGTTTAGTGGTFSIVPVGSSGQTLAATAGEWEAIGGPGLASTPVLLVFLSVLTLTVVLGGDSIQPATPEDCVKQVRRTGGFPVWTAQNTIQVGAQTCIAPALLAGAGGAWISVQPWQKEFCRRFVPAHPDTAPSADFISSYFHDDPVKGAAEYATACPAPWRPFFFGTGPAPTSTTATGGLDRECNSTSGWSSSNVSAFTIVSDPLGSPSNNVCSLQSAGNGETRIGTVPIDLQAGDVVTAWVLPTQGVQGGGSYGCESMELYAPSAGTVVHYTDGEFGCRGSTAGQGHWNRLSLHVPSTGSWIVYLTGDQAGVPVLWDHLTVTSAADWAALPRPDAIDPDLGAGSLRSWRPDSGAALTLGTAPGGGSAALAVTANGGLGRVLTSPIPDLQVGDHVSAWVYASAGSTHTWNDRGLEIYAGGSNDVITNAPGGRWAAGQWTLVDVTVPAVAGWRVLLYAPLDFTTTYFRDIRVWRSDEWAARGTLTAPRAEPSGGWTDAYPTAPSTGAAHQATCATGFQYDPATNGCVPAPSTRTAPTAPPTIPTPSTTVPTAAPSHEGSDGGGSVIDGLFHLGDRILDGLKDLLNGLLGGLGDLLRWIGGILQSLLGAIFGALQWIGGLIQDLTAALRDAVASLGSALIRELETLKEAIVDLGTEFGNAVKGALSWAFVPSSATLDDEENETRDSFDGKAPYVAGGLAVSLIGATTTAATHSLDNSSQCGPTIGFDAVSTSAGTIPAFHLALPSPPPCPGNGPDGARTSQDDSAAELLGYRSEVRSMLVFGIVIMFVVNLVQAAPWAKGSNRLAPSTTDGGGVASWVELEAAGGLDLVDRAHSYDQGRRFRRMVRGDSL